MSAKEWGVPLVLGLLTATALWVAVPQDHGSDDGHSDGSSSTTGPPDFSTVLPFDRGLALGGKELTFIVLAPEGKAAVLADINHTGMPELADGLQWQDDHLALYTAEVPTCHESEPCDYPWSDAPWPLPVPVEADPEHPGPLLGVAGHNGTRITVHVFDEAGVLIATNAPANETKAFRGRAEPEPLPGGVWYVGSQPTAPNGTRPIPGLAKPLFEQLKPMMQGLPVGGVASTRFDSPYGVLFVTVRLDGLVQAP